MILLFSIFFHYLLVPSDPPSHMEALLLNSSAVYLKWKQPALQAHNGKFYLSTLHNIMNFTMFHATIVIHELSLSLMRWHSKNAAISEELANNQRRSKEMN